MIFINEYSYNAVLIIENLTIGECIASIREIKKIQKI